MICPVCGFDNIEGVDSCENCGSDLRSIDVPVPTTPIQHRMQFPLRALRPRKPELFAPETPVADVIARMRADAVDCVFVGGAGGLSGIFTERDAVLKLAGRPLAGVSLGEAMTADPVTLHGDDTAAAAIHAMAVGGFRHIPVIDESGAPMGVVSAVDLFRLVIGPH